MLSHTLKSLAIDDAVPQVLLGIVCKISSKVLFAKPIFQSKYVAKIQGLKKCASS